MMLGGVLKWIQHYYLHQCWMKLLDDVPTLLPASLLDQTSRRCSNIAISIIVGSNFSTMFQHCYQHHCWIKLLDDVWWSVKVNPILLPALVVGSNFATMLDGVLKWVQHWTDSTDGGRSKIFHLKNSVFLSSPAVNILHPVHFSGDIPNSLFVMLNILYSILFQATIQYSSVFSHDIQYFSILSIPLLPPKFRQSSLD